MGAWMPHVRQRAAVNLAAFASAFGSLAAAVLLHPEV